MGGLTDLNWRLRTKPHANCSHIAPDENFIAIGDVHGRADLLELALDRALDTDADIKIVLVGDYVDRGEQSKQVLEVLIGLERELPGRIMSLKGNHEAMLLNFLDTPDDSAQIWWRNGGLQTLASFDLARHSLNARVDLRDAFADALGAEMIAWLRALQLFWQTGNVFVSHAGGDPLMAPEHQSEHDLLWGHRDYLRSDRNDDLISVHGHWIVERPEIAGSRVSIDTGAYATGCLTIAHIRHGDVSFQNIVDNQNSVPAAG